MNNNFRNTIRMIQTYARNSAGAEDMLTTGTARYKKVSTPASKEEVKSEPPSQKASDEKQPAPSTNTAVQPVNSEQPGNPAFTLDMNPNALLQGLIYSEIFGKPKCMRRGR